MVVDYRKAGDLSRSLLDTCAAVDLPCATAQNASSYSATPSVVR